MTFSRNEITQKCVKDQLKNRNVNRRLRLYFAYTAQMRSI